MALHGRHMGDIEEGVTTSQPNTLLTIVKGVYLVVKLPPNDKTIPSENNDSNGASTVPAESLSIPYAGRVHLSLPRCCQ
jgi:hypothetical protein